MKRYFSFKSYIILSLIGLIILISCSRQRHDKGGIKTTESPRFGVERTSIKPKIEVAKETKHYDRTKSTEIIRESALGSAEMEIIEEPASLEEDVLFDVSKSMTHAKKRFLHAESMDMGKPMTAVKTEITSGQLTAGELNDFTKWDMWTDLNEGVLSSYRQMWEIFPKKRYTIQLKNKNTGMPIVNTKVELVKNKEIIFTALSDNTGKAELWAELHNLQHDSTELYGANIYYNGSKTKLKTLLPFKEGINQITLDGPCQKPKNIDICFVVDATGSMGDEIRYLQSEVVDVINKIQVKRPKLKLNLSSVFYKDVTDDYITKTSPFSSKSKETIDFIKSQSYSGGGDYPEALDEALLEALKFNWSNEAISKILFLIMDAPSHNTEKDLNNLKQIVQDASSKGIRIVPIAGSGIQKATEFLMRSLALSTNGTYVFLTDDSGIGHSHIKPSTDKYDVEKLNDLMVRLVLQYTEFPECNEQYLEELVSDTSKTNILGDKVINYSEFENILSGSYVQIKDNTDLNQEDSSMTASIDSSISISPSSDFIQPELSVFPNPSHGLINVSLKGNIESIYIRDLTGKIIKRIEDPKMETKVDLSEFPTGMYFVTCPYKDRWLNARIIISNS